MPQYTSYAPVPAGGIHPLSATGCNGGTCIHIEGSSTDVEYIEVYAVGFQEVPASTIAIITENGNLIFAAYVGPNSAGVIVYYYQNFPNGAKICGELSIWPGYPCETIKA
jgi:hypothetical protein